MSQREKAHYKTETNWYTETIHLNNIIGYAFEAVTVFLKACETENLEFMSGMK